MNTIRYKTLLICLLSFIQVVKVHADENPFRIIYHALSDTIINVTYNNTDSVDISNINEGINGLALDCEISRLSKNSFVRILLEDTSGKEFLVLESNKYLNNNDSAVYLGYCEETASLSNVYPQRLKIYIRDAIVTLNKIKYSTVSDNPSLEYASELFNADSIRKRQVSQIVDNINSYNSENNKLWTAGVTTVSLMDYETKKRVLGVSGNDCDTGGFEYYVGGVFEVGDPNAATNETNDSIELAGSSYVESFDWRNRHGKNWITPAKSQVNKTCWAYAATAMLETYVNLYYNRLINYDLSEQDVISCNYSPSNNGYDGGYVRTALIHMKNSGIVDEVSFPSNINAKCEDKTEDPIDVIRIEDCNSFVYNVNTNYLKKNIIISPFVLDVFYDNGWGHSILLVGYKTIVPGDTVITSLKNESSVIVSENDYINGKTVWFFKNSYGEDWGTNGYGCFIIENARDLRTSHILGSVNSCKYTNEDIVCSDNDGDGFYYWGIGAKPSNLDAFVPDTPDGDDSNERFGPMDMYGNLRDLHTEINDTMYITKSVSWDNENYMWRHIVVKDKGILNITSKIKFYKGVNIIIESGGIVNVDGGKLENVNVEVLSGGKFYITNKGTVNKYKTFNTAVGAKLYMDNGFLN